MQSTPRAPAPRARRDALLKVIREELDQRPELEADLTLRTLTLVVVFREKDGRPVRIMLRAENQRDLHERPHVVE
jgi:hypothetical protein